MNEHLFQPMNEEVVVGCKPELLNELSSDLINRAANKASNLANNAFSRIRSYVQDNNPSSYGKFHAIQDLKSLHKRAGQEQKFGFHLNDKGYSQKGLGHALNAAEKIRQTKELFKRGN